MNNKYFYHNIYMFTLFSYWGMFVMQFSAVAYISKPMKEIFSSWNDSLLSNLVWISVWVAETIHIDPHTYAP